MAQRLACDTSSLEARLKAGGRKYVALALISSRTPMSPDVGGYGSTLGGYTAIFDGWFVFSGGLGLQYLDYTIDGLGMSGLAPTAHTTIGFAF